MVRFLLQLGSSIYHVDMVSGESPSSAAAH